MFTPLQLPGGVELLVVLLIFLILVAVPVGLIAVGLVLWRRRRGRIEDLEARIEALESSDE